jgi:hypothetical protein
MERQAFTSALVSRVMQVRVSDSGCSVIQVEVPFPPQNVADATPTDHGLGYVQVCTTTDDDDKNSDLAGQPASPVLAVPCPPSVVPVSIAWRRRSSSQDITNMLSEVKDGQKHLRTCVEKAARISDSVLGAVQRLKEQLVETTTPTHRLRHIKPGPYHFTENNTGAGHWVKLFQWAVSRVILKVRKNKTKKHLNALAARKRRAPHSLAVKTFSTESIRADSEVGSGPFSLDDMILGSPSPTKMKRALRMSEFS